MTSRNRNLSIIGLMLVLLAASGYIIASKPTVLGLDLRGGVELVYEGRPTPAVPTVTPQAIDDAIETIRKRTDSLGVSEPEIQRAGSNQISVGLPNVSNADRAQEQVGSTAQLQFYDWEPNVYTDTEERGGGIVPFGPIKQANPLSAQPRPFRGGTSLFDATSAAATVKPRAEAVDIPPGGASEAIKQRYDNDQQKIRAYYDRQNDSTSTARYYLFGPDKKLITGPERSCESLLADFEGLDGERRTSSQIPKAGSCKEELAKIPVGTARSLADQDVQPTGRTGPPAGSSVVRVPRGIVVLEQRPTANQPESVKNYFVVEDDTELAGSDLRNPMVTSDQGTSNQSAVSFELTNKGQAAFARVTKREAEAGSRLIIPAGTPRDQRSAAYYQFGISLDNQIISLANINPNEYPDGIDGRTGAQISGLTEPGEAKDLAENLRIGALPIELKQISQTRVSATLGQQALDQGLLAGGVGLLLTMIFLLIFYRVLGGVAALALVVYGVFLFALVKLIPITLTLPGIAGMVLTLGVAADANIVIFERIKEEARHGRSIPAAIANGYSKALRTIIDANVVTIGVAFILFTLATAGIKGFAFTLGVGTIVSLFTAVLATSAILGAMARTRIIGSRFAIGASKEEGIGSHFDFVGLSKFFFSGSGVILVVGALAIAGLGINFGIDFDSGTRITTPLERPASVDQVRDTMSRAGYENAEVQGVNEPDLGRNVVQISTGTLDPSRVESVRRALDADYGVRQATFQASSIGPTFGAQIAQTALIAIIASLILISLYIALRFEPKFAVPVLIALSHDILITAGVYALFGREVTSSTVAALLTILGYSLYDTIIVFDRIRENVPRMPRATFSQIVNRSMSEVIVRSLVTSFSTLLPVLALMIFGGETLRDFAFALLVGVASGAYSSIFIAAPVLTLWKEREPMYVRRRRAIMADNDGHVPAFASGVIGDANLESGAEEFKRERRLGRRGKKGRGSGTSPAPAQPSSGSPEGATGETQEPQGGAVATADRSPSSEGTGNGTSERAAAESSPAEPAERLTPEEEAKRRRAANRARKKHGRTTGGGGNR